MATEVGVVLLQVSKPVADMVDYYGETWGIGAENVIRFALAQMHVMVEGRDPELLRRLQVASEAAKREHDERAAEVAIAWMGP